MRCFHPHFGPSTSELLRKSFESSKGSLWVHSGLILPSQSKAGTQTGNGFPGSKAKDVEFWSNTGRDFFFQSFSAGKQSITQTTARMSSVNKDFEQECSGENLTSCNLV